MPMRITGMSNSGIDIDAIVKDSLKPYKLKVQKQEQQKQILEWKQEQYQAIMKKASTFYNKYLDPTSADSLYSLKAYNQTKFESNSSAVSVSGSSTSNISNYTVNVTKIATKSSATISGADLGYITSGNKISIQSGTGDPVEFALRGANSTEMANNLSADLASKGLSVTARYSTLANNGQGGFIIENKNAGDTNLTVKFTQQQDTSASLAVDTQGSFFTNIGKSSLVAGNIVKINGTEYTLNGTSEADIATNLNNQLQSASVKVNASFDATKGVMTLKATQPGDANKFTASTIISGKTTDLTVNVDGKYSTTVTGGAGKDISDPKYQGININGQTFRLSYIKGTTTLDLNALNSQISSLGVQAKTDGSNGFILTSMNTGTGSKFTASVVSFNDISQGPTSATQGQNLSATISNETGTYTINNGTLPDGSTLKTGNKVTIDGTTFTFNAITTSPATITGSQDVSGLVTKIKSFVKDYNELIGLVNGKTWEEYDKDYQPLTDDQREAMSDSQIEKWEKKAQTGLLRRDDDVLDLSDSMKNVMSSFMMTRKLDLENIGIKPVNDFKELNGTYEVDDEKLTKALQNNFDGVKDLFMKDYLADDTTNSGIIPKLKSVLKKNFIDFDSVFNKKAASSGVYALTNEMSKQITEKKNLIYDMNKDLTKRENSLYSKYSKLEQALANAQSQQSSMSAWFGSN